MTQVTATDPISRQDLSEGMTRAHSLESNFTTENYLLNRKPDFFVYLYNVSEMAFKVSRPPIIREMVIPGRSGQGMSFEAIEKMQQNGGNKELYILATRFPSPLVAPKANVDSSDVDYYATDTRRFVMDIINPDNLGIDQDAAIAPSKITSKGNNLGAKGVFFSLNNPPAKAEVDAAVTRMERGYRALLDEARTTEAAKPAELSSMLSPEHHSAADYYAEVFSWHGKKVKAVLCNICGERTKEGAAFHKLEDGGLCIADWTRAIKSGVRTRAQAYEATEDPQYAPKAPAAPVAPAVTDSTV